MGWKNGTINGQKKLLSSIFRPQKPLKPAFLLPKVPKMGHFGAKNAKNREACPEHGGGSASSVYWAQNTVYWAS